MTRRDVIFVAGALCLALAAYWPGLFSSWIADDYPDLRYIAGANPLDLVRDGLWGVPGGAGRYRPVLHLFAKCEWWLFGTAPSGYHVVALALHVAASVLLWRVLSAKHLATPFVAAATALLWVVHPLHPEAVAWFAALGGVLAVFFVLLALLSWLHGRRLLAWCAALAALFSHEGILLFPVAFAVVELLRGRGIGSALRVLGFFATTVAVCFAVRLAAVDAAFGGELTDVLALVPGSARAGLVLQSVLDRARLLLMPAPPAFVAGRQVAYWVLLGTTLVVLAVAARRRRIRPVLALLAITFVFYLPSAVVQIRAADHANARQLYPVLVPWLALVAGAFDALGARVRWLLFAGCLALYTVFCAEVNARRDRAAQVAAEWSRAARAAAARADFGASRLFLLDPPLVDGGMLVLENAAGTLLARPFVAAERECHVLTAEMLRGLAVVPEARSFVGQGAFVLRRTARGFVTSRLDATPPESPRSRAGFGSLAVEAVMAPAAGAAPRVLHWTAGGTSGETVGWPLPGTGKVLFPVGSDVAWLLAGRISSLAVVPAAASLELRDRLPPIRTIAPPNEHGVTRGGEPIEFRAERAGIGPTARIVFRTWPGPVVLPATVPVEPLLRFKPARDPSAGGAFAWSIFESRLLFDPNLICMYWCFEELDPLGRVVARSPLRRLIPE